MTTSVHELVTDVHPTGMQGAALDRLREEAATRPQKLIGAWAPEYGFLSRVITLWEGPRSALSPLAGVEASTGWLDSARGAIALTPRRPVRHELLAAPVLELRGYATHEGQCDNFVKALLAALPHREKYSPNIGLWTTRERGLDVVWHLWAYDSFEHRMAARDGAMKDDGWSAYRASIRPMLKALQASMLMPVKL